MPTRTGIRKTHEESGAPAEGSEGVEDGVVLDLVHEARDIDQRLGSEDKIDAWFEAKTKGLNDWQKDELKKQWGTMRNVLSSKSRNRNATSETIENNVRRKIIKEHFSDPAYYEKMSALLDEIIMLRKSKALEYEDYLKRIADLARRVEAGLAEDTPEQLKSSPALRALYNNLKTDRATPTRADRVAEAPRKYAVSADQALELALNIDAAVKRVRPDGWRGVQPREQVIKAALYDILRNEAEVERIFLIVKAQREY